MASTSVTVSSVPEDHQFRFTIRLSRPLRFRLWLAKQLIRAAGVVMGAEMAIDFKPSTEQS
jgi:hypothetical protein